jgi:hypothetical protein
MGLIHFILDLAALLLWLNWRAKPYDALAAATPATLVGTLRRAESRPVKRWYFLAALIGLLLLRAVLYRALGPALNWTGQLNLGVTSLAFKSDLFDRMLLFSVLSFAVTLVVFCFWLLLLAILGRGDRESISPVRLARAQLGFSDGWPVWLKLLLPFLTGFTSWWALTWPLSAWSLIPSPGSEMVRLAQAGLVGLGSYLAWKYLVLALLGLHLLHNHVYFGPNPLWSFVDQAARLLLAPLRFLPLRLARLDLAPVVGIGLVLLFTHGAEHGLRPPGKHDEQGRPMPPAVEIPGLVDLYRRVSR